MLVSFLLCGWDEKNRMISQYSLVLVPWLLLRHQQLPYVSAKKNKDKIIDVVLRVHTSMKKILLVVYSKNQSNMYKVKYFHSQNSVNIKNGYLAIWITFFKCQVAVMKHSEHISIFCLLLQIWQFTSKHLSMHQSKINLKVFLGTAGHFLKIMQSIIHK